VKTIGLIGGMSWESSAEYYKVINEGVRDRLGGLHSAKSLMFSFDFADIEELQHHGKWGDATQLMVAAAQDLERGGADLIIITTNTMHKMADAVEAAVKIPLVHIADPTAEALKIRNIKKVALLGTKYTMEQDFYKGRLVNKFGFDVITPLDSERKLVNEIIYDELCLGEIKAESRSKYVEIIGNLQKRGAEAVILGCTEIGLLIKQSDVDLPVFDTTKIHAEAAVSFALAKV
jgi:aspartate racemase